MAKFGNRLCRQNQLSAFSSVAVFVVSPMEDIGVPSSRASINTQRRNRGSVGPRPRCGCATPPSCRQPVSASNSDIPDIRPVDAR